MVLEECYFKFGYCGWTSLSDKGMWKLSSDKTFIKYPGGCNATHARNVHILTLFLFSSEVIVLIDETFVFIVQIVLLNIFVFADFTVVFA